MTTVSLGFTPTTCRPYDAPLLRGVDGDTVHIDQSEGGNTPGGGWPAVRLAEPPGVRRRH